VRTCAGAGFERILAAALLLGALASVCAGAAAPRKPQAPQGAGSTGAAPVPIQFTAADTVPLTGTWFAGPPHAPTLVLSPRGRRPDPGLDSLAGMFQQRGFNVLTFALRDPAPASAEQDSLRYLLLTSSWVEDVVGALKAARARTDSTSHLFVWGQGMGGVLAIAALARAPGQCEGLAAEQLFRTTDDAMKRNGTFVIPEAIQIRNRHLYPPDEPISAAARLNVPALAVLTGPEAGTSADVTLQVMMRDRGRVDRWKRPWIDTPGLTPTASDADTISAWFIRWTRFPRSK
jgi:pimeloyl-ACP methyl ester carboxylesterase